MKAPATYQLPNISVNKYMLIVKPSASILDRVKRLQQKWKHNFRLEDLQLQSGYLLLAKFGMLAAQEERLLRRIHYAAMECPPYRISIDGFWGLPDHSVGLKIANPASVKQINHYIQAQFSDLKFPGERPYYNHYPAIGLASRLLPQEYFEIWKAMENRHFNGAFVADQLLVLRKIHDANRWGLVGNFAFENLPVQSKQGVLFA
jgi:2'-5' RNA ligase